MALTFVIVLAMHWKTPSASGAQPGNASSVAALAPSSTQVVARAVVQAPAPPEPAAAAPAPAAADSITAATVARAPTGPALATPKPKGSATKPVDGDSVDLYGTRK